MATTDQILVVKFLDVITNLAKTRSRQEYKFDDVQSDLPHVCTQPVSGDVRGRARPLTRYLYVRYFACGAALFDPLDECVSGTVVGDGEAQGVCSLGNVYFLSLAFGEEKVSVRPLPDR